MYRVAYPIYSLRLWNVDFIEFDLSQAHHSIQIVFAASKVTAKPNPIKSDKGSQTSLVSRKISFLISTKNDVEN